MNLINNLLNSSWKYWKILENIEKNIYLIYGLFIYINVYFIYFVLNSYIIIYYIII